jgi:geranylgeranyl diphosphate synthase, type II
VDAFSTTQYFAECRRLVLDAIRDFVPRDSHLQAVLYGPMLDYPFRPSKGLRPALCIATCGALGGRYQEATRSAAALELYHNAFLIHDDVEDGSDKRRDGPTLHRIVGVPSAINIGDAMLAVALQPLLDNLNELGLGPALRILQVVARMSRESAEGQAIELDWIRRDAWNVTDREYVRMVHKKTGWYSFVAPVLVGGAIAGTPKPLLGRMSRFAALLGVAFQIQDDLLNLTGHEMQTGKESGDDLLEGKRTLMLLHVMRAATAPERQRLRDIVDAHRRAPACDANSNLGFVLRLMRKHGSLTHGRTVAARYAASARRELARVPMAPSTHRDLLFSLVDFVVERDR